MKKALFAVTLLAALSMVIAPAAAQITWSSDIRLTDATGDSTYPMIAVDSNGNVHIAWSDFRDGNYEIYYTKLDNDGNTLVDDTRLTDASGDSAYPSIAVDSSNNVHIAWHDKRDGDYEIYYTKLDNDGNTLVDDTRLTDASGYSKKPSITVDSNDNIHIAWYDKRDGNYEIYYTKLDNNGNTLVDDTRLTDDSANSFVSRIAVDHNDNIHIAWADKRDGNYEIYYTKLDNNGNTLVDDTRLTDASGDSRRVGVAVDSSNNVHIAWTDKRDGNEEIYYTKLDNNGNTLVDDTRLTDASSSRYPLIAVDSSGNVHIDWYDCRDGNNEIYYTKLDNNGNTLVDDTRLTDDSGSSMRPSIAVDSSDNPHVAWWDDRDGNYDIYYKKGSVAAAAGLADTPWPMYHHDLNHTGLSPYTGPDTNATKWTYEAGFTIRSSPAIGSDGTIYIGSGDNKLYAIYPNGTLKWSYLFGDDAYSSPAIGSDGTIYMGSRDKNLYAINPNGTLKWSYLTGEAVYSPPAIEDEGTIYVGSKDKNLYAINPNGTLKWSYLTGGYIYYASPAIGSDGTVYIGSYDDKFYAIYPNGTLKWSYLAGGDVCSSPAIGADGTIYVGSKDFNLYAIYPNGTHKWSYLTGDKVCSSPAIGSDGTIYMGSDDYKLYAIYPNGTHKWSYLTGDKINYCAPAIDADGTIYVGSRDDKLYAVYPNGTHKWSYLTGGNIDYSSPAIGSDGTIYVGSYDYKLYAFGPGEAAEPDLLVTDINAYHNNTGCSPWFNLSNEIDVTVKNNGSADAGASNVCLYIEDVLFGKLPVSSLSAGASETVTFENWKPVGDDCLQPVCDFSWSYHDYNLTGVADCDGDVAESNETNNETTVVERACYNGYIADEPLENVAHGKLHGHLLFTTGNGVYTGLYSVGDNQVTNYDITIPAGATVKLANLNVYYTWHYEKDSCPQMEVSITNATGTHVLPLEKAYNDIKCWCPGASWEFPWGNYVYDLTDYIQGSGTYTYTVTVKRTGGPSFCVAAPGIVLVYEDENAPVIEYWVNKGADVLTCGRRSDGGYLAWWECINNATFTASSETGEVVNATLGVVAPWGGSSWEPGTTNYLFFNDIKLGTGVYHGYSATYDKTIDSITMHIGSTNAQVGVNVTSVTAHYLNDSDNVVGQADDGDCMMPSNAFLVVEYEEEGICGDVNKDGDVNVLDATKVKNRAGNPSYPLDDEWAADVNCDMSIDVRDATKVMNRAGNPGYPLGCCT